MKKCCKRRTRSTGATSAPAPTLPEPLTRHAAPPLERLKRPARGRIVHAGVEERFA